MAQTRPLAVKHNLFEYLKWLRTQAKLTQQELNDRISFKCHINTFKKYERNQLPPTEFMISLSHYLNLDFRKLMVQWIKSSPNTEVEKSHALQSLSQPDDDQSYTDQYMSCASSDAQPISSVCQQLQNSYGNKSVVAYRQTGQSMSPLINNSDWVLIDTSDITITDGEIYYIRFNNQYVLRRLQTLPGERTLATSQNSLFVDMIIESTQKGTLVIIGKLVGFITQSSR